MEVVFFAQLFLVLGAILLGTRMRGVGLGVVSCLALSLLVLFFDVKPVNPPYTVLVIMIAALTAGAALEGAGTLDLLTAWVERIFTNYPHLLTWLSPLIIYLLVLCTGTSHIIYVLLPVIVKAAQRGGISPAKPLIASVIASQQAILASPVSAATSIIAAHFPAYSQGKLMLLFLPATFIGTFMTTWVAYAMHRDPSFCVIEKKVKRESIDKEYPFARIALLIFLLGVLGVVASDYFFRYQGRTKPQGLTALILLSVAGIITCFTGTKKIAKGRVFSVGMEAVIAILGVAWLSSSFLEEHKDTLIEWVGGGERSEWQWALFFFLTTIISTSQGATLTLMLPLALSALGPSKLLYIIPAINSFYVLPSYPTVLAAVAIDKTRSIRIGRFVINHSFLLPGLVGTCATCLSAYFIHIFFF